MAGVYRGVETVKADEAQSLWRILQGHKRHEKRRDKQLGKRGIFSAISDIGEAFLPPGYKQLVDVGSKQLEQELFELPEYKEKGDSFWGSKEIAKLKGQDVAFREGADETLLEGIIRGTGDYISGGGSFDLSSLLGGGGDSPLMPPEFNPSMPPEFNPITGESIDIEEPIPSGMLEEGQGLFAQGGLVSQSTTPTIADYFSIQGKTLGGSNTQSLAEKLGRK